MRKSGFVHSARMDRKLKKLKSSANPINRTLCFSKKNIFFNLSDPQGVDY